MENLILRVNANELKELSIFLGSHGMSIQDFLRAVIHQSLRRVNNLERISPNMLATILKGAESR